MINNFKYAIWFLHVWLCSSLLVNCKQLNVTRELFKASAVRATEWAWLFSCIRLCSQYLLSTSHVPGMLTIRNELVDMIYHINLVFGT